MGSTSSTLSILDPTAPPRALHRKEAPRLPTLTGRRVGFLWNSKPNGDILFGRLEEMLRAQCGVGATIHERKPGPSEPATPRVIARLASSVDAAIIGLGD